MVDAFTALLKPYNTVREKRSSSLSSFLNLPVNTIYCLKLLKISINKSLQCAEIYFQHQKLSGNDRDLIMQF